MQKREVESDTTSTPCCKRKKSIGVTLPLYALSTVFSFLSQKELLIYALVCKKWCEISHSGMFWSVLDCELFKFTCLQQTCRFIEEIFKDKSPIKSLRYNKSIYHYSQQDIYRLRKCTNLTNLDFPLLPSNREYIDSDIIKEISRMDSLSSLDISTHTASDECLDFLTKGCPNLTKLSLDFNKSVTCNGIIHLIEKFPKLQSLSAMFCPKAIFDMNSLAKIAHQLKRFKNLSIELDVSPNDFSTFVEMIPRMETINLRGLSYLTGENLTNLSSLPSLRSIELLLSNSPKLYNPNIKSRTLQGLVIQGASHITNMNIICPNLIKLNLLSNHKIDYLKVDAPQLSTLNIRACTLHCHQIPMKTLKVLELFDCFGFESIDLNSNTLKEITLYMLTDLKHVFIRSDSLRVLNIDICMHIAKMTIFCENLTKTNLYAMPQADFPILSDFSLYSNKITSLSLQRCVNLKNIEIHSESLTALSVADCKVLENINLRCYNLSKFVLSAPFLKFTNQFIQKLALECPKIYMLSLCNSQHLGDSELEVVLSLWDQIQALVVSNCKNIVSPKIIAKQLKGVQFIDCVQLQAPIFHCENLAKLFFKNCISLSNSLFMKGDLPNLKQLEITDCVTMTQLELKFPELKNCCLNGLDELESIVLHVASMKQLSVVGCPALSHLNPTCTSSLVEVSFVDCFELSDECLNQLTLKSIFLSLIQVTGSHRLQNPFLRGDNIKHIAFTECTLLKNVDFSSSGLLTLKFTLCPNLKYQTHVRHTKFLLAIMDCNGIESLYVANNETCITSCRNLKTITFINEVAKMVNVKACQSLEKVTFEGPGCELNVANCEKFCHISGRSLTKLALTNCLRFGDESLESCLTTGKEIASLVSPHPL
jgi:hypothetical protein